MSAGMCGFRSMTGSTSSRGGYGIRQNSPTGSFRIKAKIANGTGVTSDDARVGIWVANGTTSNEAYIVGLQTSVPRIYNLNNFTNSESADWSAFGGTDSALVQSEATLGLDGTRFRMDYDSVARTLAVYYSTNGVFWRLVNTLTSINQPTRMGIAIWANVADIRADHAMGCDYFRVEEF